MNLGARYSCTEQAPNLQDHFYNSRHVLCEDTIALAKSGPGASVFMFHTGPFSQPRLRNDLTHYDLSSLHLPRTSIL